MNGRMYDPLLSSFLSPDNYMQNPTSQQGFNRYAYCMYNPLKYVDPSGYRYYGYDESYMYRVIDEITQQVLHEWYSVYDMAVASVQLTINMACGLYSHGLDTHGNGSGHGGGAMGGGCQTPYVDVHDNGDGTYTVVGGVPNEDCSVYVVDDQGNRTYLGTMLTPYSFFNEYGELIKNSIIYKYDNWGQEKWNDFQGNTPWLHDYLFDGKTNGLHGGDFDFKVHAPNGDYYHGMFVDFGEGLFITTPRDLGNVCAGYEAGVYGIPYYLSRRAMDQYNRGPEPPVSRYAQDYGYRLGQHNIMNNIFNKIYHFFIP